MKKIPDNQIAFYQSPDGSVNIEVLFAEENIWLTQKKMAELFDCSTDNVSLHLKNIYKENEVDQKSTTEEFSVVRNSGGTRLNSWNHRLQYVAQGAAIRDGARSLESII
ncbi:MAG: hypothetical protein V2A66_06435 [Pseudomonadota bacterium]